MEWRLVMVMPLRHASLQEVAEVHAGWGAHRLAAGWNAASWTFAAKAGPRSRCANSLAALWWSSAQFSVRAEWSECLAGDHTASSGRRSTFNDGAPWAVCVTSVSKALKLTEAKRGLGTSIAVHDECQHNLDLIARSPSCRINSSDSQ